MRARHGIAACSLAALLTLPFIGLGASAAGAAAVPGAPQVVHAFQYGGAGAEVSWKAPTSDGGSPITGYVVTPFEAGVAQPPVTSDTTQTTAVLKGLPTGKSYSFSVAASNAVGTGSPSARSGAITVGAPGQPLIMWAKKLARPGTAQVRVNRGIVNQTNGAPVLRLNGTCTSSNGGATGTGRMMAPKQAPTNMNPWVVVGHLTVGKTYRCTVTATNSRGTGVKSKASTPLTV